jgi:aldehyde dehydrogenase (NAD+)
VKIVAINILLSVLFPVFLLLIYPSLRCIFAMASPLSPHIALANLQATALAARCHNAFFRQQQLKFLHDALRNNVSAIKDAIKSDTHVSDVEASTEVALALNVVKEHYSAINPKKELEEEYRIAHGKNAENSTKPWDVAYIEPQRNHTPFFSAIVALSAAVAAGSCVALKVR